MQTFCGPFCGVLVRGETGLLPRLPLLLGEGGASWTSIPSVVVKRRAFHPWKDRPKAGTQEREESLKQGGLLDC